MRTYLILSVFVLQIAPCVAQGARGFIHEFYDARKIEKSDPEAAAAGMIRCLNQAVLAGNSDYATAGGLNACHMIYRRGRTVETGKLAREVITALEPLDANWPDADAVRRVPLFGFMERGYVAQGNLGEAMRSNRAAAETLRGKKVTAASDGPPITIAEVKAMRPELRSLGWRLVEREAYLLDLAGRTHKGLDLLNEAATFIGKDGIKNLAPIEQFYALKLLETRATVLDFLGYDLASIQAAQEILAKEETQPDLLNVQLNTRLSLIQDLSQWHGPSEEYLELARTLGGQLKSRGSQNNVERLLAQMEFALTQSQKAADSLRDNGKKYENLGDNFEASYADRDNLIARSKLGEKGLDREFHELLIKIRKHGNKRGEPGLYRIYGSYLLSQKRPAEAISLLLESLRLTRSFGWTLHEPSILGALFDARFESGDVEGAKATLAELGGLLTKHSDMPAARRVKAEIIRANALASLRDPDGARAAFAVAQELAKDLPDYQKRALTPENVNLVLAEISSPPPAAAPSALEVPQLRVQPLEIVSIALPGEFSTTRFSVFNPTDRSIRGRIVVSGPGACLGADGVSIRFRAGEPAATVGLSRTLAVGGETVVRALMESDSAVTESLASIAWENDGQAAGPDAHWETKWDPAALGSVILDASRLETNPYRSVSLFHELAIPVGEAGPIAFRLRSPASLRLEYYTSDHHELVAIDANGNGDFTEAGDLSIRGPDAVSSAIFPISPGDRTMTVEVRIYATDGLPLIPAKSTMFLDAEVYRNGAWSKEAENTLK